MFHSLLMVRIMSSVVGRTRGRGRECASQKCFCSPALFQNCVRCAKGRPRYGPAFMTIINTAYFAIAVLAASIFAFTASRLKLAPFCIGGNAIAVMASFSTSC